VLRSLKVVGSLLVAVAVVLGFYYAVGAPVLKLHEGDLLPAVELPDLAGQTRVQLHSLRGRAAVVVVFDTRWPGTAAYLRQLEKLHARYYSRGLVVIGISTDADKDAVDTIVRTEQISFFVLRDPGALHLRAGFGPPKLPTPDTYLITPELRVAAALSEPVDWLSPLERKRIEDILPPPPARNSP
jgi:peroxiredoxin